MYARVNLGTIMDWVKAGRLDASEVITMQVGDNRALRADSSSAFQAGGFDHPTAAFRVLCHEHFVQGQHCGAVAEDLQRLPAAATRAHGTSVGD